MEDMSGEQARLEQAISDTEIAITAGDAWLDTMIRNGEDVYRETQQLKMLHARLAYYNLRRRMLLAGQALNDLQDGLSRPSRDRD
jgi:hypothetical protein